MVDFDEDFGPEESYDYSQHIVGNTAAARQVRLAHDPAPQCVVGAVDDSDDWEDEPELVLPQQMTVAQVLYTKTARKRRSSRSVAKRHEKTSLVAELMEALALRGFTSLPVVGASATTLRNILRYCDDVDFGSRAGVLADSATETADEMVRCDSRLVLLDAAAAKELVELRSAVSLLPYDVWGVVTDFLHMLSIYRLSSTCTYLRAILEDGDAFRRRWARTSVQIILRGDALVTTFEATGRMPPRAYLWSWHFSARRAALLAQFQYNYSVSPSATDAVQLETLVETTGRQLRECDAAAWLHVYKNALDPNAKHFAQIEVNRAVGMACIAFDLALEFPFDRVEEHTARLLRIPRDQQDVAQYISALRVESLGCSRDTEVDAAATGRTRIVRYRENNELIVSFPRERPRWQGTATTRRFHHYGNRNRRRLPPDLKRLYKQLQNVNADGYGWVGIANQEWSYATRPTFAWHQHLI